MIQPLLRLILALLLTAGISAGCGNSIGAMTPEAAVQRVGFGSLPDAQIVGVRYLGDYALVLYTQVDRSASGQQMFNLGYTFVGRTPNGWRAENNGAMGVGGLPDPAEILQYSVGSTQTPNGTRSLVFGRALDPQIASVEAVFDDGRTARDEVTNGVFAVVMTGAEAACALRSFDAQGAEVPLPEHVATPLSPDC